MSPDEAEIRRILAAHSKALHDKDVDAAVANVAPDILSFDLAPPLASRGVDRYRKNLEAWFPGWDGPIDHAIHGLELVVDGDLAVISGYVHMGGSHRDGDKADLWARLTGVMRKLDGRWLISHEHVSVPFHMDGSLRAAVDLTPDPKD